MNWITEGYASVIAPAPTYTPVYSLTGVYPLDIGGTVGRAALHDHDESTDVMLPNETLTAIFEGLSPSTLADISCVSQRFRAVAERLLYTSVLVTETLSQSSPIPCKTLRCCETLLQRGHLAEFVRKLHVRWLSDANSTAPPISPWMFVLVKDALQALTALESLELFLGPTNLNLSSSSSDHPTQPPMHAVERIIDGCQLPTLRYCSLGAEWTKGVPPYGGILNSFLISVPSLRHFRLSDHHAALRLPPEALPCLSSFRGSPDTAASLLPGRPVHTLSLVGLDSDVNRDNLPRMMHTTVPLRCLDLSGMSIRLLLLQSISTYLPTVEVLRVRLALRHTLHYAMSGIRILTGLSSVLSTFPNLVELDLSPTIVQGISHSSAEEELSLCIDWSRNCPTLRRITFPSRFEWVLNQDGDWEDVDS